MQSGTKFTQQEYATLEAVSMPFGVMAAKAKINEWFGFEYGRIEIINIVEVDITQEGARMTTYEFVERTPCYNATDWNYVRFDVGAFKYECINGEIELFIS